MLKVVKFGGSSLADAAQFAKVRQIVTSDPDRRVVVVSAPGKRFDGDHKITDLLYLCCAHLQYGVSCENVYGMIADRYRQIAAECGLSMEVLGEFDVLYRKMQQGISQDELVSRGEYFAARLMAEYLGYDFLDAADWLQFTFDGQIDREHSYEMLRRIAGERRVVIPGFYGVMPDGHIRVLTRGGSDVTGALAAAALTADVYENWTDVSGILMADPRIVEHPRPIERITYSELRELSYMGAQVLHEASVFPVRQADIPLNIRNTNEPEHPGTLIREYFEDELESEKNRFITGIAGRRNFSIVTMAKNGLSPSPGSLRRVLEVFERHNLNVEYTPSGIDSVSLVVQSGKAAGCLYSILGGLQNEFAPDKLQVAENISIVAAVGRKMACRPGTSGKIFAALGENGISIRMISQGPEELNIIVGVDNADFEKTVRVLYDSFVK